MAGGDQLMREVIMDDEGRDKWRIVPHVEYQTHFRLLYTFPQ